MIASMDSRLGNGLWPRWLVRLARKCTAWGQRLREGSLWPSLPWKKRGPYYRE
jgi:hypothetical protein